MSSTALSKSWPKVSAIAINDQFIAFGTYDSTLVIWSFPDQKSVKTLRGHTERVTCMQITNDSKYIVSGSKDKTVRIWSFRDNNSQAAILRGHPREVTLLAVTSDNNYIVSCSTEDYTLRSIYIIWSFQNTAPVTILKDVAHSVNQLFITHDSKYLVYQMKSSNFGVWNFNKARFENNFRANHYEIINIVKVASDNKFIVSTCTDSNNKAIIRVWNLQERKEYILIKSQTPSIKSLEITHNGKYVVSESIDHFINVWKVNYKLQYPLLTETDSLFQWRLRYPELKKLLT